MVISLILIRHVCLLVFYPFMSYACSFVARRSGCRENEGKGSKILLDSTIPTSNNCMNLKPDASNKWTEPKAVRRHAIYDHSTLY